ncbi:hypothetical protein O181_087222 [Austropuccinia psidii MF-1]|uniref:Uncharacterized protein n=1 Tax=Austropuccinia psidii MF-1 TaxID=1389203 RepID=A0A9Q3P2S1_9BASI|nr:hypothetical protein [Austropuccinia psidii MF-1]
MSNFLNVFPQDASVDTKASLSVRPITVVVIPIKIASANIARVAFGRNIRQVRVNNLDSALALDCLCWWGKFDRSNDGKSDSFAARMKT